MHRKLLIGLLAFGTVAGFGSGFASLARHGACHRGGQEWGYGPPPAWAPPLAAAPAAAAPAAPATAAPATAAPSAQSALPININVTVNPPKNAP